MQVLMRFLALNKILIKTCSLIFFEIMQIKQQLSTTMMKLHRQSHHIFKQYVSG
jgi:hypothetical protein